MPGMLHHIPIFILDMDCSLHLFHKVLGFDLIWRLPRVKDPMLATLLGIPGVELEMAYLQGDNDPVGIELVRMIGPENPTPATIGNGKYGTMAISFIVDDIEASYNRLTDEGWPPSTEIMAIRPPDGSHGRVFCFNTEEGIMIEILEITANEPNQKNIPVSKAESET